MLTLCQVAFHASSDQRSHGQGMGLGKQTCAVCATCLHSLSTVAQPVIGQGVLCSFLGTTAALGVALDPSTTGAA